VEYFCQQYFEEIKAMKRRYLIGGILILAVGIGIAVKIAGLFSEEGKVKRAVSQGVKAFEARDLTGCLGVISNKYEDAQGWDKPKVREGLMNLFNQFSEIKTEVIGLKVNIEQDKATVKCAIRVRGKGEGTLVFLVGNLTSKEEAVLFFAREEGTWRLVRVEGIGTGGQP
jgi:hypothetical protein